MLFDILCIFCVAGGVILFIWLLRGLLLMPLKIGKSTQLTVLVKVKGAELCLEQTVKGLNWLKSNGTLPGNIVIMDDGMDEETIKVSERLAANLHGVSYQRKDVSVWETKEHSHNSTEGSTLSSTAATTADTP